MMVEVIHGRKIPIGTIAYVVEIYYFKVPGTNIKIKRAILDNYGSTDFKNLKEVDYI